MSTVMRLTRSQRLADERIERWISGEPDLHLLSVACWFAELLGNAALQVALMNKGAELWPRQRAQGIGIDSLGGDLVPEPITSEIIALRQKAGIMRQNATPWTIRHADVANVPRRTSAMATAFIA